MVAVLLFGMMAPLSAQNLPGAARSADAAAESDVLEEVADREFSGTLQMSGNFDVSVQQKAQGELPSGKPMYVAQDSLTLNMRSSSHQKVDSVVDMGILRNPSPYRRVLVSAGGQAYNASPDSLQNGLALISAVYREVGKPAESSDCTTLSLSVEQRVKLDVSKVLEIVEAEVTANPSCACEIVKTAIKASEADVALVVSIVETTINASPENMRIVSQCAIAAMPEAIGEVQALLAKLDPNTGEGYSSKSAKSAKSAKMAAVAVAPEITPNPLDLPPGYPPIIPPIFPPPVTNVNP